MTRAILSATLVLLISTGGALAADPEPIASPAAAAKHATTLSTADQAALQFIHVANVIEIRAGEIGKERAKAREVKLFADRLIKGHKRVEASIRKTAEKNGFALAAIDLDRMAANVPSTEVKRMAGAESTTEVKVPAVGDWTGDAGSLMNLPEVKVRIDDLNRLKTLRGAEFDHEFVSRSIEDRGKTVETLKAWQGDLKDREVKLELNAAILDMDAHRQAAIALQKTVAGEKHDTSGKENEKEEKGEKNEKDE